MANFSSRMDTIFTIRIKWVPSGECYKYQKNEQFAIKDGNNV